MKHPLALALALALAACASPRPAGPPAEYVGALVPTGDIRGAFLARQHVSAHYPGGHDVEFDAVMQKQGDTLTLLGMTPFGTRAFLLQQRGTEVSFTSYLPRELPFPPRYMLLDIHRTFFIGLGAPPAADGERRGTRDGEEIVERWQAGRLMERRFRRLDGRPAGDIVVRYGDGMQGHAPPRVIEFRNGWFGYTLSIETTAHQTLPDRAPDADAGA